MRLSFGRPSHATVVAYVALFVALGGTSVAATGGTFVLGRSNYATTVTSLSNSAGTPLSLSAKAGYAPLAVNSTKVVTRLNADLLDGLHSTAFQRAGSKSSDANRLDGLDSTAFQRATSASCPGGTSIKSITASGSAHCSQFVMVESQIGNLGGSAKCPAGTNVISGGYSLPLVAEGHEDFIRASFPESDILNQYWTVRIDPRAINNFQVNQPSTVYALCLGL